MSKYSFSRATVPWAPRDSVIVVKLRTSEKRTVATVSWPPIMSVPSLISWSAMPGSIYRDIVDFILFSSEISSIMIIEPRWLDSWSVRPSGSWLSSGIKLKFAETISLFSSILEPTSKDTSINIIFSLFSLHSSIFSLIHILSSLKKSDAFEPIMSSRLAFKMVHPALLQVAITPSSLMVMTPLDMLASMLWLYARSLVTSSKSFAFSSAIDTCCVNAFNLDSSSSVNPPPTLLRACVHPIQSPSLFIIGTHKIDRVK